MPSSLTLTITAFILLGRQDTSELSHDGIWHASTNFWSGAQIRCRHICIFCVYYSFDPTVLGQGMYSMITYRGSNEMSYGLLARLQYRNNEVWLWSMIFITLHVKICTCGHLFKTNNHVILYFNHFEAHLGFFF